MAIIIKELNYIYSPGTPFERAALKNINLTINDGEYIGLIGHTGSGKSTLIQHFNGLLKPSGGSLSVQGIELSAGKPDLIKLRSKVGLVFQYPEYQLFEESVAQDIAFGPKNLGLSEAEAAARVSEAMSLVGLPPEMGEKSPFELSGGQKRRAAVAGVIAMRPEVLVLDEPIAGLDPKGRREMLELIDGYRAKTGATIVLVSHNMDDVAQAADRVIVMSGGEIKKDGTPHEIFKDVAGMQELSLDVPQAALLADLLRSRGMPLSGNLISARELIEELIKHKDAILARRREAGK
ncbi:MAG: energy-coupling factor transporter ATPase [Selenomonadales bacterium]|jgi:cobalt import ATP-binding protein cbiO 1|nr:energy-coupling factor transporter ATPase [Clostridiales bacterium]PWL98461.1 MAG: energy-coupling factor transporter ATPase [Selenomonadales bacterium]